MLTALQGLGVEITQFGDSTKPMNLNEVRS
jgi:hypothetical protein